MTNKLSISKDNLLIQAASSNLSLNEQRIILLCLACWDSREKIPENREFIVSVDDIHSNWGISKDAAYKALEDAADKLYEQSIFLDPNDPKSEMRWISAKIHRKEKYEISLFFSPQIIPFISGLETCFTTYKLKDVIKFESSYSFRFYELLASWKDKGEIKVEIEWIREVLQLGDKYPVIADLKKRIVLPALADINKTSDLMVTYEQVKKGKSIRAFIFKYAPKKIEKKPPRITRAYIEKYARPGESYQQAHDRLSKKK